MSLVKVMIPFLNCFHAYKPEFNLFRTELPAGDKATRRQPIVLYATQETFFLLSTQVLNIKVKFKYICYQIWGVFGIITGKAFEQLPKHPALV